MPPYALLRCHVYNPGILPKHCSGAMSTILGFYLSTAQVPCLRSWDSTYALLRCHVYDPGILPMHCSGAMSTILGFYLCTAQVPCLRSWDSTYASSEVSLKEWRASASCIPQPLGLS